MGVAARVVVLASGKGSNLRALHAYALANEDCPFQVVAVVSDNERCDALAYAQKSGLPTALVRLGRRDDRLQWDKQLTDAIASFDPNWVVLAGFMRIVGNHTVRAFDGRMVNIHPSLLPSFRGLHAVAQALRAGVRIAGCTVHLVDHDVDTGPILGQAAVPVFEGDDERSLQERIQSCEHLLLPAVMKKLSNGGAHSVLTTKMVVV